MPGSLTTPGRTDARTNASVHVVFRKTEHVDTRDFQAFAAQWLAYVLPYRRFAVILADANARLGANADCYSFIAVDFHHLLFAGFYRRTGLLDMTVPFSDRSAGFIWFFSFLVSFSQVKKDHGNVVILLDEPGLSLHGCAQADLLRYIEEKLKPDHQVIFTTHSPFMVPPDRLDWVRTVEDVVVQKGQKFVSLGTKVGGDVLSTDRDTLFPLQAALGYEITQSLFVGEHTLLVEGPSDILFLKAASNELSARGRSSLDKRWIVCPSKGIDKVAAFLSLFGGNKLHVAVLLDYTKGQKAKVDQLKQSKLLQDGHVFTITDFVSQDEGDVEDLLGVELYVKLVNATYSQQLEPAKILALVPETSRLVRKVEAAFKVLPPETPEFDHYRPATWLIENPKELRAESNSVSEALGRFEELFKRLNALLPNK